MKTTEDNLILSTSSRKHGTSITQSFDKDCVHKGFYTSGLDSIRSILHSIKNEKWNFSETDDELEGFAYEDADVFRMGACNLFSLALNHENGLSAYELRGTDNRFIHAFCAFKYFEKTVYVDVRGATSDLNEFLDSLYVGCDENLVCVPQNVEMELANLTTDEKYGYEFALEVIRKNPDFYSAEQIEG